MAQPMISGLRRLLAPSIQSRLFWLFEGVGLGMLCLLNLAWLPGTIHDIRATYIELQNVAVHEEREEIFLFLEDKELVLRGQAKLFRAFLLQQEGEPLHLFTHRFFQIEPTFVEFGLLDAQGKERFKVSRFLAITDADLGDRSMSTLFQEAMQGKIYWGPVVTTETAEPWITLALPIEGPGTTILGVIYGTVNLKALWEVTGDLRMMHDARAYVVDQLGQLIASNDPNLVLSRLLVADRPLIRQLMWTQETQERQGQEFVHGDYINEYGVRVQATGLRLPQTRWSVVVEQPQALLYRPMTQKLWFAGGLSAIGVLVSLGMAHVMSQRFTRPILRLREGVLQLGRGDLTHQVPVETVDEIGDLALQFNWMVDQLRVSHHELASSSAEKARDLAILYAVTQPVSQTSALQHVLDDAVSKIMEGMGAQAGLIALLTGENGDLSLSVSHGFSEACTGAFSSRWRDGLASGGRLGTGEPIIAEAILDETRLPLGWLQQDGFQSGVSVPLRTPEKLLGMLALASRERGRFRLQQRDLFLAIAYQLSVTIENIRLHAVEVRHSAALGQMVRALEESEAYNRTIIETAHDAFLTVDEDGVILTWNQQAEVLFGWSAQEAIGRNIAETILPPQFRQALMEQFRSVASRPGQPQGVKARLECTLQHRSGREFPVEVTHSPMYLEGQYRNHAFFHDISERQQAEQMKADFVSFVTHQLRTPLSGIKWLLELATSEEEPMAERLSYIQDAQVSAERLITLVNDLLDVSRLERGKMKIEPQAVQLVELTQDVLAECAALVQAKHHRLSLVPTPPIAPVWVDPQLLRQVILNLVSNAIKFTPEGGAITIAISQDTAAVRWWVRDNGIGIPAAAQGHIFEKFYRADNAYQTATEGTGFGLYISRLIVEQCGGQLWFESQEGAGTTFSFTLPLWSRNHASADQAAPVS